MNNVFRFKKIQNILRKKKEDIHLERIGDFFEEKGVDLGHIDWPILSVFSWDPGTYLISEALEKTDFSKLEKGFVVLNSSGKDHARTYFLVNHFLNEKITYVHIDAHTDFSMPKKGIVNSASFVGPLSNLENVEKIMFLGVNPENLQYGFTEFLNEQPFLPDMPAILGDKFNIFLASDPNEVQEPGYAINVSESILKKKGHEIFLRYIQYYEHVDDFNPDRISTNVVYISVDMDVVEGFPSRWRKEGKLNLERIVELIDSITSSKTIIGSDICGFDLSQINKQDSERKTLDDIFTIYNALQNNL
ncbi:hypothetical protein GOV08_04335 [Candidatus Woesearchaeota archaeon]|nr:hypothetical protein [Candidatus Woesearchaeota archaeon]